MHKKCFIIFLQVIFYTILYETVFKSMWWYNDQHGANNYFEDHLVVLTEEKIAG